MDEVLAELGIRFLAGGALVSLFALLGDLFQPKSFSGLFGAAPSVAVATLALTVHKHGPGYAAVEARSMALAAFGLYVYCACVSAWLYRRRRPVAPAALAAFVPWFAVAGAGWMLLWVLR